MGNKFLKNTKKMKDNDSRMSEKEKELSEEGNEKRNWPKDSEKYEDERKK